MSFICNYEKKWKPFLVRCHCYVFGPHIPRQGSNFLNEGQIDILKYFILWYAYSAHHA